MSMMMRRRVPTRVGMLEMVEMMERGETRLEMATTMSDIVSIKKSI